MLLRFSRKRRIILPRDVCDRLSIVPEDYVRVYIENGRVVVEKVGGIDELAGVPSTSFPVRGLAV